MSSEADMIIEHQKLLVELEWSGTAYDESCCPCCDAIWKVGDDDPMHKVGCKLKYLMEKKAGRNGEDSIL